MGDVLDLTSKLRAKRYAEMLKPLTGCLECGTLYLKSGGGRL